MFDRRKQKRTCLAHILSVFREESAQPFGQLLNINPDGMMLRTTSRVTAKTDYRLKIELPSGWFGGKHIVLEAKSVWCQPEPDDSQTYRSGFQLVNLEDKDLRCIAALTEHPA